MSLAAANADFRSQLDTFAYITLPLQIKWLLINFSQALVSHVEILLFFRHVILPCRKTRDSSTYQNLAELVRYFK